jgi:hypothetical protein
MAFKLALLVIPTLALAEEGVLPNDVLVGGMDSVLAIRQSTSTIYEIAQLGPMTGAPPGNTPAICAGAALAHMKGYPGLSFGAIDDGVPSGSKPTVTLALLKGPAEVASLPANLKWLPYRDIKSLRQPCSAFVPAKYLWPAN